MDVPALLRKLRDGQKELESNVRALTRREGARQSNEQGKVRARKFCCSPDQRQKPTKRARTTQLSPQPPPLPRRLSSTPKASDKVPSLDLSLENALRTRKDGCHDSRVRFAQDTLDDSTSERHSFLVTQQQQQGSGGSSKIKSTGTNVSFTEGTLHTHQAPPDLGTKLVESLNASKFGALERGMRGSRGFPRHYKGDDPRLGYDWIAGMLDTEAPIGEKDDKYYVELKEFRRVNRSECCPPPPDTTTTIPPPNSSYVGGVPSTVNSTGTPPSPAPAITTCVSSYVLNDRLFPVPVHTHSEPGVLCPVCEGSHDPDGAELEGVASIRYIKVSVPRCTLQPVSRLRAQRRGRRRGSGRSPGATESMGLSKHCQAGWETAQPATIPPQPSVNLKSFLSDHTSQGNLHCPSDSTCRGEVPSAFGHTHKGKLRRLKACSMPHTVCTMTS
ncbi:hypothetical protein EMCRGX_G017316 [Ephydatia muelleri]